MTLTESLIQLCQGLDQTFSQKRTVQRASSLILASLLCAGRKWITRINCVRQKEQVDWSADYKMFSRSKWKSSNLFIPAIKETLSYFGNGPIILAGDETRAKRGGRKVKRSRWTRDPMSPPFHTNFIKGIRFVQFSALLPLYKTHNVGARGIPVSFEPVDRPPKPHHQASEETKAAYKLLCKQKSMCNQTLIQLKTLRQLYDQSGGSNKKILLGLDGGFCNRTMFGSQLDRTVFIARGRKDAVLCFPANDHNHPRRVYGKEKFTPDQIRTNDNIPWQKTEVFYGGQRRIIRYKEVKNVLWQGGAKRKLLRIIVVAPMGYRLSPAMPKYYRQPAYLFANDHTFKTNVLLQCYFDRWQIEVNHRDEKQHIGMVDAQVWNDQSVDRLPAFMVASYSFLLLASLMAYGPKRTEDYMLPPKWQRKRRARPSCLDLISKFREEARDGPQAYEPFSFTPDLNHILFRAA